MDQKPSVGINYYRVNYFDNQGNCVNSAIVKVEVIDNAGFSIYPNPLDRESELHLVMNKMPIGNYHIRIINSKGRVLKTTLLQHSISTATYNVALNPNWSAGTYHLELINEDSKKRVINFIYK